MDKAAILPALYQFNVSSGDTFYFGQLSAQIVTIGANESIGSKPRSL
jgi:hypothetical protein